MNVIKEVRNLLGLELKAAKEIVDNAPSVILTNVDKFTAENAKSILEESGATVEIRALI